MSGEEVAFTQEETIQMLMEEEVASHKELKINEWTIFRLFFSCFRLREDKHFCCGIIRCKKTRYHRVLDMYDKGKQLLAQDFDIINVIRQQKASSAMLDSNITSSIVQRYLPSVR